MLKKKIKFFITIINFILIQFNYTCNFIYKGNNVSVLLNTKNFLLTLFNAIIKLFLALDSSFIDLIYF